MSRRLLLAVSNLIAFIATVAVNALAVILPINNRTTQELSDAYPNLFVPAGLTFSIWSLIYLLLAVFCIFSLLPAVRFNPARGAYIDRIGWLFVASCILNIGWILAWHYELVAVSVLIMLGLLLSLIVIYLRLDIGRSSAGTGEKYLTHLPFSIYLGWISVATIANITALLVFLEWNLSNPWQQILTVAVIAVAITLSLVMLVMRRDIFYALVVDWALLGILLKRLGDSGQPDQWVIYAAVGGLAVITAGVLFRIIRREIY